MRTTGRPGRRRVEGRGEDEQYESQIEKSILEPHHASHERFFPAAGEPRAGLQSQEHQCGGCAWGAHDEAAASQMASPEAGPHDYHYTSRVPGDIGELGVSELPA